MTEVDKSVYDKLIEYQDILMDKFKLEELMDGLPKVIASKNEILSRLKKTYLTKHKQYKKLEENLLSYDKKVGELKLEQADLEEKIKSTKTQKEFEVVDKTIRDRKEREEELHAQMEQDKEVINDLRSAISDYEIDMKRQEDDIAREQERINAELAKVKKSMEELEAKEKEVVDGIDEEFRAKFEKIVRNKEGRGIVAVTCGYCTGCHLVLPQEFINKVRSNDKIYFCQNCSRTLYFREDDVANGENIFSAFGNGDDDDDFFNAED